ncbi:cysteine-rich receptor-like protein kinase 10, partial [Quercus suber]
ATNKFSDDNKLSGGGFGEVYKAWEHWSTGTSLELLEPTLRDSWSRNEVNQCIHIVLLCVQENPADRPTMASIILMPDSYSVTLKSPQQPAVFILSQTESTIPME